MNTAVSSLIVEVKTYTSTKDDPWVAPELMVANWHRQHCIYLNSPGSTPSQLQHLIDIVQDSPSTRLLLEQLDSSTDDDYVWTLERHFKNDTTMWYHLLTFNCLISYMSDVRIDNPKLASWIAAHPTTWSGEYVEKCP